MRVLLLLNVAAALVSPRQPAAPITVRRGSEGGQFGGRKGCCWKADSYLNAMESPAEPEQMDSTARRLTAGGPPAASNLWHHEWLRLLDSSLRKCSGAAILPAPGHVPVHPVALQRGARARGARGVTKAGHGGQLREANNYAVTLVCLRRFEAAQVGAVQGDSRGVTHSRRRT